MHPWVHYAAPRRGARAAEGGFSGGGAAPFCPLPPPCACIANPPRMLPGSCESPFERWRGAQ